MKNANLFFLPILFLFTLSTSLDSQIYNLSGTLSPDSEVPPVISPATGSISGTYNQSTGMVTFDIDFSGLLTDASAAHLHSGATGVNGGIIITLTPPMATSGNIGGTFPLPMGDETDFLAGNTYINIHTSTNPGGEIRGQVIAQLAPIPTVQTWGIIILFCIISILGVLALKFKSVLITSNVK